MKLDLILENIRNQYTLGLLEESTGARLDEKTVLKGKMLINESTMELRKILIQEGVLADVRAMLADRFARVIEEATWEDFTQGLKNAFTAPESQRSIADRLEHERSLRHEGFTKGFSDGEDAGHKAGYKAGHGAGHDGGYNKGAAEYTDYITQATEGAGKVYNDAMAKNAADVASMKAQHSDAMAALQAKHDALQAKYDNSVSGQVNSAVDQAKNVVKPYVDQVKDAYNTNVEPTVKKAEDAISAATNQVKDAYNTNVGPTVEKAGAAINNGYQSAVGTINNGVTKVREAYDAASPYQLAGAGAAAAAGAGALGYGAYRMGQRRR